MKVVHLEGKVFSGIGEGRKYVRFVWVRKQVKEKLGFTPYIGTLNIRLDHDSVQKKKALVGKSALKIVPAAGYCSGKLFNALLKGCIKAAIVVPEVPNYPENVLEIISSENLRKGLLLNDGDKVQVEIIL